MFGNPIDAILSRWLVSTTLACGLVAGCCGGTPEEPDGPDTQKIIAIFESVATLQSSRRRDRRISSRFSRGSRISRSPNRIEPRNTRNTRKPAGIPRDHSVMMLQSPIFREISQVPRCSKNEERISAWLVNWAQERSLAGKTDAARNVIISVPGSQGRENEPPVALQAHIDMVCAKTADSPHDFTTDPITLIRDGQWLHADRTTLGADDGMGVAIALFLASEPGIDRPPLELVFTTDEEVDMSGAASLLPDAITARRYVNLDWETEGSLALGAAGGTKIDISLPMPPADLPNEWEVYNLDISGLLGGHSGISAGKNRANANVLAARTLKDTVPVRVIAFDGGTADNAIAPSAVVALAVAAEDADALKQRITSFLATLQQEYPEETGLTMTLTRQQTTPSTAASLADSATLFALLLDIPQDVYEWSTQFPGLPGTSNNIGTVNLVDGAARLRVFHRSFDPAKLEAFSQMVEDIVRNAGATSVRGSTFPTWPPAPDSMLYKQALASYEKALGRTLETIVVHAGLECGFIAEKYPGIEIISVGPTLLDVHTPNERLHVPSVEKVSTFMRTLLKDL